jgi:hypothetical protein
MLKKVIRKAVVAARKWLMEDGNSGRKPATLPRDKVTYDWLNRTLFPWILAEGGSAFRPSYVWGVLQGVHLAEALGISRVSVIEFGVAGGKGLISLEKIAQKVESVYGVEIDVYGFDTGVGLPKPKDYRDLPNLYSEGRHSMDIEKLRERLKRAQLVLGLVENTIADFIRSAPSPVAFVSIDLDLYSSTVHALRLLDAEQDLLLPRIHCYFDDIIGFNFCEYNGERLAIADFNASHEMRKIAPIYALRYFLPPLHGKEAWTEGFFLAHIFDHDLYGHFGGLAPVSDLSLPDK